MTKIAAQVLSDSGSLAPLPAWDASVPGGHGVQFYEDDAFLLDSLSRFMGAALAGGDSVLVVATREHREGLRARLNQNGLDLSIAEQQGPVAMLDAAEAASKLLVDGHADPARFEELIVPQMTRLAAAKGSPGRIAVFGEIVSVLWQQ